jgi:6-phosphogluconolactonase (cycloisomerase 2 family)
VATIALVALSSSATAQAAEPNLLVSESNASSGNQILVYEVASNGAVRLTQRVDTGQAGTGDYMHTSHAVESLTTTRVLAVNAGASTVSVLDRSGATMAQTAVFPVTGLIPTSIATHGDRAYVLSTGMPIVGDGKTSRRIAQPMIEGFTIAADGTATSFTKISLAGGCKSYPCNSPVIYGGIVISPDGRSLLLSESSMNRVRTFALDGAGAIGTSTQTRTQLTGPYGAVWASTGVVAISGHTLPKIYGAVTSGRVRDGKYVAAEPLMTVKNSNTCWLTASPNGSRLYTMDAGADTREQKIGVTTLRMTPSGSLTELGRTLLPWSADEFPSDAVVSDDGKHLYAKALQGMYAFDIDKNGVARYVPGKSQFTDPLKLGPTGLAFVAGA